MYLTANLANLHGSGEDSRGFAKIRGFKSVGLFQY